MNTIQMTVDSPANRRVEIAPAYARWKSLARTRCSGFLLLAAIVALWECSARFGWIVSENWPPVSRVVYALFANLRSGELTQVMSATLYRVGAGYVLGSVLGVALGLLLARSKSIDWLVRPPLEVVRTLPGPAILPPLILFLGVEDSLKIFVISLGVFFPVFVNTYSGAQSIDSTLLLTARTFRLGRLTVLRRILLPAISPYVAAGMRISLALSLTVAVTAEMISGASGIGFYLMSMQYAMRADSMYAAVVLLAATGYLLNRLFIACEGRALFWRNK